MPSGEADGACCKLTTWEGARGDLGRRPCNRRAVSESGGERPKRKGRSGSKMKETQRREDGVEVFLGTVPDSRLRNGPAGRG